MKRLFASLVVLVLLVLGAPPALSAGGPDVSLRLLDMAPWLRPDATDLHLKMAAVNSGGRAADDLSFGVTVFQPTRTRNEYEESLHRDPTGVLFARFDDVPGKLIPAGRRVLRLSDQIIREVGETVAGGDETAVYPMSVELRSGDHTLASVRTPIVFLNFAEHQVVATTRLRMSWVFALHQGIAFGPDGTFLDSSLQSAVAPTGRLAREVKALADLTNDPLRPRPVNVVWSPTLISQLESMRDGYSIDAGGSIEQVPAGQGGAADAAAVLDEMHRLANGSLVESTALPFAVPNIPALISAGLGIDVPTQVQRGQEAVEAFTGHPLAADTFWPPGGYLDQASLTTLSARGVRTFLMAPGLVHRDPQPKEFAQPATTALPNSLTTTVTGIVPDAGVTSILGSPVPQRDPRLATQDVLGELAQIWLEQPGVRRAVSMSVPDSLDVPGGLFPPLLRILSRAPFLQVQKVSAITKNFHPDTDEPARLFPNRGTPFTSDYITEIANARADIGLYRSILVEQSTVPDQLESEVLLSEGAEFSENPDEGLTFLTDIRSDLGGLFHGIRPDTSHAVTLASGRGVVPIGIVNDTPDRVRVQIRLISVRLEPEAQTETVLLQGQTTRLLPFRVTSRTTGRFPVQIRVLSPDGVPLGQPQDLIVRSTSYNLVALILVLGAAVFLLLWWARRFLPRSRPPQAKPA
jgi:hypothetical protein